MKRTISSILAVVMAMAMVLSMTVFASAAEGEWLDGSAFVPDAELSPNGFEIVPDAEGHGFKVVVKQLHGSGKAGALVVENELYRYLVVEVDEVTTNGWSIEGINGGWSVETIRKVVDLSTKDGFVGFAGVLWLQNPADSYIHIKEMYLTNDPDVKPSEGGNGGNNEGGNGGNNKTGVESAVAVAAAAVIGAGALIAISRKK